ncbi:MAG: 2-phospho-L-lactate guanylyltransferase [Novosphingobium sp.]
MTCWAIIPAKPPGNGKNRLSPALDEAARSELVRAMLGHVVAAVEAARNIDTVCLIGSSRHGLPQTLQLLDDPGTGLNAAVASGFDEAVRAEATRVVVIHGDLPQLTVQDVELLAAAAPGSLAIAPDRHGTGTNALSLPVPEAENFTFAFGPDSFARHCIEAGRLELNVETIHSHGLAYDIDEPDDLPDAAELLKQPR